MSRTPLKVVVIDYNGGNLASAAQATRRASARLGIAADVIISRQEHDIIQADRLILPGQGAFSACMKELQAARLIPLLEQTTARGTPFLGICVGMQLMAGYGLEHGRTDGLGWIHGHVARMEDTSEQGLRLPHMGWNTLDFTPGAHPLTEGLEQGAHGYFVHSYALKNGHRDDIIATTHYGGSVPAIVAKGLRCGTQFHVEKSQETGLIILGNFLQWQPKKA